MAIKQIQYRIPNLGPFSLKILTLVVISVWLFGGSSSNGCISSDPDVPEMVSFFPTEFATYSVVPSLPLAYLVVSGSLKVLDLGDPSSPVELNHINLVGDPIGGSAINDPFLYIAFENCCEPDTWKLEIYNTTQAVSPSLLSSSLAGTLFVNITADGSFVYAATYPNDTLMVISIEDPYHPVIVASLDWVVSYGLIVRDGIAYGANAGNGLTIIDVTDPAHPAKIGNLATDGAVFDIALQGDFIYASQMGSPDGQMLIIDISDPTAPKQRGMIKTRKNHANPRGIGVSGNYAYVAFEGINSLEVVDIRDPDTPRIIGSTDLPDHPQSGVEIADNLILVPVTSGLAIYEIP